MSVRKRFIWDPKNKYGPITKVINTSDDVFSPGSHPNSYEVGDQSVQRKKPKHNPTNIIPGEIHPFLIGPPPNSRRKKKIHPVCLDLSKNPNLIKK